MIEIGENKTLRQKRDEEEHIKIYGGWREGKRMKTNTLARPNGLHEKIETAISDRGPRPARKKEEVCQ